MWYGILQPGGGAPRRLLVLLTLGCIRARELHEPRRVRPPSGSAFRPMHCAPTFELDATGPDCSRTDVEGVDGAFVLSDVLTHEEAASMVAMAERMGFEQGEGVTAGRTSAAVSWCFHDRLAEQLIRRMAPLLPWAVAVCSPTAPLPSADQLPDVGAGPPWVRQVGGCPEGMYVLDSLNCRMRVYRYESDSADRFLPHYDEVWPGSRLAFGNDAPEGEPTLRQDSWRYSSGATAADPNGDRWAWSDGDRVSHLTVLLCTHRGIEPSQLTLRCRRGRRARALDLSSSRSQRRLRWRRDSALSGRAHGRGAHAGLRAGRGQAGHRLDPLLWAELQVWPG